MADVTTVVNSKAFYKSKIFWLALATIFLSVADQAKLLTDLLPTQYQGLYTAAIGVAILVARLFSGQSVSLTNKSPVADVTSTDSVDATK